MAFSAPIADPSNTSTTRTSRVVLVVRGSRKSKKILQLRAHHSGMSGRIRGTWASSITLSLCLGCCHLLAGTVGPTWPTSGKTNIIERVNSMTGFNQTRPTNAACSVSNRTKSCSSTLVIPNCDVKAPGPATNAGCLINSMSSQIFGAGLNAIARYRVGQCSNLYLLLPQERHPSIPQQRQP